MQSCMNALVRAIAEEILVRQKSLAAALRGGGVSIGPSPTVALRSTVGYFQALPPGAR
jgi:uncharacterized protein with von Willebrand factor type A (vWA) domain